MYVANASGLNHLPVIPKTVRTPVGMEYDGVSFQGRICGVSIMRGESVVIIFVSPLASRARHSWRGVVLSQILGELTCTAGEVGHGEIAQEDPAGRD